MLFLESTWYQFNEERNLTMARKLPGEMYLGEALHVPLSSDGQIAAYVWPLRILTVRESKIGGPTIGVEVGNEEVLRFDCHAAPGHWHGGGYDRLESPGNSHRDFPQGLVDVEEQLDWSFHQILERCQTLLEEAEHGPAGQKLVPSLVQTGIESIKAHLVNQGDLRSQAIADNLISV
jgi:hypothetical protein